MDLQKPDDWPHFLTLLRPRLEKLRPPRGAFDPNGEWQHRYAVLAVGNLLKGIEGSSYPYGTILLKRIPEADGQFRLEVDLDAAVNGSGLQTSTSIVCNDDRLGTPKQWELRSRVKKGELMGETALRETGEVRGGMIVRRGKVERKIAAPKQFTSNWNLLEAVQRLPFEGLEPLTFDMFEDMDLHKPGQRLAAVESVTVDMGGQPVRLHCFRQIGRGILPIHYWLDDQHRLIAVNGGVRGIIWDGGSSSAEKEL